MHAREVPSAGIVAHKHDSSKIVGRFVVAVVAVCVGQGYQILVMVYHTLESKL